MTLCRANGRTRPELAERHLLGRMGPRPRLRRDHPHTVPPAVPFTRTVQGRRSALAAAGTLTLPPARSKRPSLAYSSPSQPVNRTILV